MRWRGCDNSDGRLQIADDRYRVVGNRRPLQRHSERSVRISKKRIRFFVTSFLRMTGKNSCHSERQRRISNYALRITHYALLIIPPKLPVFKGGRLYFNFQNGEKCFIEQNLLNDFKNICYTYLTKIIHRVIII